MNASDQFDEMCFKTLSKRNPVPLGNSIDRFMGDWWIIANNGQRSALGLNGLVANDPTATLAVHCGNGFDAGFSPYQSTRLSRYNAAS
jgi:hypothetical protein